MNFVASPSAAGVGGFLRYEDVVSRSHRSPGCRVRPIDLWSIEPSIIIRIVMRDHNEASRLWNWIAHVHCDVLVYPLFKVGRNADDRASRVTDVENDKSATGELCTGLNACVWPSRIWGDFVDTDICLQSHNSQLHVRAQCRPVSKTDVDYRARILWHGVEVECCRKAIRKVIRYIRRIGFTPPREADTSSSLESCSLPNHTHVWFSRVSRILAYSIGSATTVNGGEDVKWRLIRQPLSAVPDNEREACWSTSQLLSRFGIGSCPGLSLQPRDRDTRPQRRRACARS